MTENDKIPQNAQFLPVSCLTGPNFKKPLWSNAPWDFCKKCISTN